MSHLKLTEEQYSAHVARIRAAKAKNGPVTVDNRVPLPTPPRTLQKPSKYRNRITGGYHSKKEALRAQQLRLMQEAGEIFDLREQVEFLLIPKQKGERACKYFADFVYEDATGATVVEDVKSTATKTPDYVIKRKLMLFMHKIAVREV